MYVSFQFTRVCACYIQTSIYSSSIPVCSDPCDFDVMCTVWENTLYCSLAVFCLSVFSRLFIFSLVFESLFCVWGFRRAVGAYQSKRRFIPEDRNLLFYFWPLMKSYTLILHSFQVISPLQSVFLNIQISIVSAQLLLNYFVI